MRALAEKFKDCNLACVLICFHVIIDVDECDGDLDDCADVGATCTNFNGGFQCLCNAGFTGDGKTCVGKLLCACVVYFFRSGFCSVATIVTSLNCAQWGERRSFQYFGFEVCVLCALVVVGVLFLQM